MVASFLADEATAPPGLVAAISHEIEEIRFLRRDLRDVRYTFRYVPGKLRLIVDAGTLAAIQSGTWEPLNRLDETCGVSVSVTDGVSCGYVDLAFDDAVNPVPPARAFEATDGILRVILERNPEYESYVNTPVYRSRENIYVGETETGRAYVFVKSVVDIEADLDSDDLWYAVVMDGRLSRVDHYRRHGGEETPGWYDEAIEIIRNTAHYGLDSRRGRTDPVLPD